MILSITEQAADQIKRHLDKDGLSSDTHALRINIVGGGCSGLSYRIQLTDDINSEKDFAVKKDDITVVLDQKSALYLMGSNLDYIDTLMETGFKINNPNAKNTCGCGESFGI